MPERGRTTTTGRMAGLAIAAVVVGAVATSGLPAASASAQSCSDLGALSGQRLASCIHTLRQQAESAGKAAEKADEAYLTVKHRSEQAKQAYEELDSAAARAAVVAQASRTRAAVVAAHLARTGGAAGQTADVFLSGNGASATLYHLSRMSELTSDTSQLAADAQRDEDQALDLRRQAQLAADRVAGEEQDAKHLYDAAKKSSDAARMLVARAEEKQNPGSNAANIQAYADLPSDASVTARVLAFARAQIGKPYVFGAAGPGAWDCSGLTMGAFASVGRSIGGHGVNVQYQLAQSKGLLVPRGSAQPGDLLFYGSGDHYHVAVYSGPGTMIEAPMPGRDVRETAIRPGDLAPVVARFTG